SRFSPPARSPDDRRHLVSRGGRREGSLADWPGRPGSFRLLTGALGAAAASLTRRSSQAMSQKTFVIGVGMTKFDNPGSKEGDYPDWAREAGSKALADAGIAYELVEQAFAGYCYGDSTYGQRAIYGLGLTRHPAVKRNHKWSTRSRC